MAREAATNYFKGHKGCSHAAVTLLAGTPGSSRRRIKARAEGTETVSPRQTAEEDEVGPVLRRIAADRRRRHRESRR